MSLQQGIFRIFDKNTLENLRRDQYKLSVKIYCRIPDKNQVPEEFQSTHVGKPYHHIRVIKQIIEIVLDKYFSSVNG